MAAHAKNTHRVQARADAAARAAQAPSPAPRQPVKAAAPALVAGVAFGPNFITIDHWNRLEDGELLATSPRIPWTLLMHRTFGLDPLDCPGCGGRRWLLSAIADRATARKILEHLRRPADQVAVPRARAPDWPA